MQKITQIFIFAAGRGERMKPLTDKVPKPLVKIKGKAIIDHIISNIPKVKTIIINAFYLKDKIQEHFLVQNNPNITISSENEKLETAGGLKFALENKKFDKNKPIFLINGDIYWNNNENQDFMKLEKVFFQQDCDILLGLKKKIDFKGYEGKGDFNFDQENGDIFKDLDDNHDFKNITNKSQNLSHVFIGIQIINPKILDKCPNGKVSMSYFYKNAKSLGIKIKGTELKGKYFHIGDKKMVDFMNLPNFQN